MHIPPADGWPTSLVTRPDLGKLPNLNTPTVAGISVAIAGNVLISLALNCQKLAHRRLERKRERNRNFIDLERERSKVASNGQSRIEEVDESGELTPTAHSVSSERTFHQVDTQPATVAVVETEPLLHVQTDAPTTGQDNASGYGSINTLHLPSLLSRLAPWSRKVQNAASSIDRAHVGATHSLMPVDVITVRPAEHHTNSGNSSAAKGLGDPSSCNESNYLRSKLWWLGFLLMNVGEMGNFISYAFAPASIVAPLGTFALIANCVFAPLMLGEQFRKRDFFGIILAIIGAVTVVLSANPSDTHLDHEGLIRAITQRVFIAYSAIYIAGAIILSGLSESDIGKRYVFIDVGLCALFGGFTVLSTKAISTLLTKEWFEIFAQWITYPVLGVLLGTGIGQIRHLNKALMRFDSKIVVPTQFVMFNLSAIVGSAILYGDFKRASFHQVVTFLYGCAATFAGVFMIAWTPSSYDTLDDHEDIGEEDENAEDAIAVATDGMSPRSVSLGSLSRRSRPTLLIPENASPLPSPILRNRQSLVSLVGLSPAQYSQRLLIVNTPPGQEFVRPLAQDFDGETPHGTFRRRTISYTWGDGHRPSPRGGRRGPSSLTSREPSRSRDGDTANPRLPQR